jgi:hypothetical protein
MTDKEALELFSMFTTAAQIAKSKNTRDYRFSITEAALVELLKKAFPSMKNDINITNVAKNILKS